VDLLDPGLYEAVLALVRDAAAPHDALKLALLVCHSHIKTLAECALELPVSANAVVADAEVRDLIARPTLFERALRVAGASVR
jgi:hypothetical protein